MKSSPQWVPHDRAFIFFYECLWCKDILVESIYAICHVSICVGWNRVDGGNAWRLYGLGHCLGGHTSNCVTCVRLWCMVVSMGRGVGDGKVVDGGAISSIVISDMVVSRKSDIGDEKMTFDVVVGGAITFDIMGSRRRDISDDGEVTSGLWEKVEVMVDY